MKAKIIIGVIVLLAVAIGISYLPKTERSSTNSKMLDNGNSTPIVTVDPLNYLEIANGYFAMPDTDEAIPGIVIVHENRGLRQEIKDTADQLAKEGYMVLAVDLLGKIVDTQEEARTLTANFDQVKGIENMQMAVKFLRDQGATKIASLGWCFGGKQALALATSGEKLDATIVYYGTNMPTDKESLKPIEWPVLGIFGDADQLIPLSKVDEFRESLKSLGIKNEVYVYPGVGHAFANPSGPNYAPEATKDAWSRTLTFLATHLK